MVTVTNDPFKLHSEVRTAYLLRRDGLLTDKEFADVVCEAVRKYSSLPVHSAKTENA